MKYLEMNEMNNNGPLMFWNSATFEPFPFPISAHFLSLSLQCVEKRLIIEFLWLVVDCLEVLRTGHKMISYPGFKLEIAFPC